jgi:HAE1 family hydrophobic/amphiphilic exporter-1
VKITNFSLRHPVTLWMMVIAVVLAGLVAITNLPLSLFPNLNLPIATIQTKWSGASPTEVEQQITNPLETKFQSLSDVTQMTSTSSQGHSIIVIEFNFGADLSSKLNDIRSDVSQVQNQLPSDSNPPVVEQYNPNNTPIMTLSLSTVAFASQANKGSLSEVSDVANNLVVPALQHLSGVGQVNVNGGLVRQVTVNVNPQKLQYYHLSIQQVTQAIANNNFDSQVGQSTRGNQLIPLQINGQFTSVNQLTDIPITIGSKAVPLGALATVQFGNADVNMTTAVNGQPTVTLDIIETSTANTVQVSNEVHQAMQQLQRQMPSDVHLSIVNDSAQVIRDSVSTVALHTFLGFLFGILIILLILRSLRTTVVVILAIPIAMLATFALMFAAQITLDTTTLGSLAVGLGSLVDFSIVVLESIFRARQRGLNSYQAASIGTQEVGLAVLVAAVAQICVFAPAIFTPGIARQFFGPIAITVSFSHIAAFFVALTVTPYLAAKVMQPAHFERPESIPGLNAPFRKWSIFDWSGRAMHELTGYYRKGLEWALHHRKTIITASITLFVISLTLMPSIGFQLFSTVYQNQIAVNITAPEGTSLSATTQLANQVVQLGKKHLTGLESYYLVMGSQSPATGTVTNLGEVTFTLRGNATTTIEQTSNRFQSLVDNIPGAQFLVQPVAEASGSVASNTMAVTISGPDFRLLKSLSDQVTKIMNNTSGLQNVYNSMDNGEPTYLLDVNQAALQRDNLSELQVETALRQAFNGYQTSTFWQGDTPYHIVVQFPESFSRNIANLSAVTIVNASGQQVPLSDLVTLKRATQYITLNHTNTIRSVNVTADLYRTTSTIVEKQLNKAFKSILLPSGYAISYGIQSTFINSALIDLGIAFLVAVALLYAVMASLFESLITPFVIMFSLPPTFIGAAFGLFLTHRSLDIDALVGAIMVVGLVTNNAIVLVEYTNQLRKSGLSLQSALLEAGPIRLRPILMSSLTTVLAMLPLVLGFGTGANTLDAMATVLACGLLFSTLVTLILVPVMYVVINRDTPLKHLHIELLDAPA